MNRKSGFFVVAFLALTSVSFAQDADPMQGVMRTGGTYANLFRFEFKPGKTDEGLEILYSTLIPAFKSAGVDITIIEDLMGTKDLLALIELKDGPRYYEYAMPEQDMLLFGELLKIAGSEQEAEIRLDKFINLLERQSQTLVYVHDK